MRENTASSFSIPLHWQAALWKVNACACFALVNGLVRYLTGGSSMMLDHPLPASTIVFFQNLFGTAFLLHWILNPKHNSFKTNHLPLHLFRVFLAVMGVVLWYLALEYMPITQAVALNFTGPIFTVIGAYIFLNERLGHWKFLAILLSFCGALLILRPDKTLASGHLYFGFPVLFPLLSAIVISCVKLCSRKLASSGESAKTLTTYLMVFMTPVSLIPAIVEGFVWPTSDQWFYLIALGALATGAHLSTSKAYVTGEVTFIMPFGISKILFSAVVGYLAFAELPQLWTVWLGSFIIFTSVMLLGYQNYKEKKCLQ